MPVIVQGFLEALFAALPKLWELWSKLGDRDAFLASVDSALAIERAVIDEAIRRKHGV